MSEVLRLLDGALIGGCGLVAGTIVLGRWLEAQRATRWQRLAAVGESPDSWLRRDALAHDRALLLRLLTPEQAQLYQECGFFDVRTPSGAHYRFHNGTVSNVEKLDRQGGVEAILCLVPRHKLSEPAQLTAQVLLLQSNEAAFCKIANVTRRYRS